ncbi:MAG: GGDEF domain-containing protein [Candidatus Margulisiibacteriota bacterium]
MEIARLRQELVRTRVQLDEARKDAITDPLTKLLNRRGFFEHFNRETARLERYQTHFSVAIMDIDNFKEVNTIYGHDGGDEALRTVTAAIKGAVRESDVVCRWGGEEVIIMFPETLLDSALRTAERIRRIVQVTDIHVAQDKSINRTISIGVASTVETGPEKIITIADEYLDRAKKTGKNKVVTG